MQQKHVQAPQLVALLDVDNTLTKDTVGKGAKVVSTINQPLLNALKASGIVHVYLFTNMSTEDIAKKATDSAYFSRPELVEELEKQGFIVHGVITPFDPAYDQGLGAAYENIFIPQYARCGDELGPKTITNDASFKFIKTELEFLSLVSDALDASIKHINDEEKTGFVNNYIHTVQHLKTGLSSNDFSTLTPTQQSRKDWLLEKIAALKNDASFSDVVAHAKGCLATGNWFALYDTENVSRVVPNKWGEKGAMYAYFLAAKPDWVQGCVYFDDKRECIETAKEVNQTLNPDFGLGTVPVEFNVKKGVKPDDEAYYSKKILSSLLMFKEDEFDEKFEASIKLPSTLIDNIKENKENIEKIRVNVRAINAEIISLYGKTNQGYLDKKITAADRFSQLTVLTQTLDVVTQASNNPNQNTLEACLRLAKEMESIPLFRNRLVGLLLAFVGVLALAAGIFLTVATFGGALGLALPLAVAVSGGLGVAGISTIAGGSLLFFRGPYKDLSNKLVEFSELQEKNKAPDPDATLKKLQ